MAGKVKIAAGEKITIAHGKLQVPDHPIVAFIEGEGTGREIWAACSALIFAAVIIVLTPLTRRGVSPYIVFGKDSAYSEIAKYIVIEFGLYLISDGACSGIVIFVGNGHFYNA